MKKNQKTHTCRVRGYFKVLLVPGNFHLGFHSSGGRIRKYVQKHGKPPGVDFKHTINHIYFGKMKQHDRYPQFQREFRLKRVNTLENFSSSKMSPQPGPFSFKYKLMVILPILGFPGLFLMENPALDTPLFALEAPFLTRNRLSLLI